MACDDLLQGRQFNAVFLFPIKLKLNKLELQLTKGSRHVVMWSNSSVEMNTHAVHVSLCGNMFAVKCADAVSGSLLHKNMKYNKAEAHRETGLLTIV